jgi:hypothetical protein
MQVDGLPMFVNQQWGSGGSSLGAPQASVQSDSSQTLPAASDLDSDLYQRQLQYLANACPNFRASALAQAMPSASIFCGAYIADANQFCRRVNTITSLLEVNREMANLESAGMSSAHL